MQDKKYCKEVVRAVVEHTAKFSMVEELIEFLTGASEETRGNVDATIKEALSESVRTENEGLVIAILTNFHTNKKVIKTNCSSPSFP